MTRWLATAAILPLFAAAEARAQNRPLFPNEIVVVARRNWGEYLRTAALMGGVVASVMVARRR